MPGWQNGSLSPSVSHDNGQQAADFCHAQTYRRRTVDKTGYAGLLPQPRLYTGRCAIRADHQPLGQREAGRHPQDSDISRVDSIYDRWATRIDRRWEIYDGRSMSAVLREYTVNGRVRRGHCAYWGVRTYTVERVFAQYALVDLPSSVHGVRGGIWHDVMVSDAVLRSWDARNVVSNQEGRVRRAQCRRDRPKLVDHPEDSQC